MAAGRPRDQGDDVYIAYKEAKREFRKEQRAKKIQYEKQCMEELCKAQDIDQQFFWHLVNKNKKKTAPGPIYNNAFKLEISNKVAEIDTNRMPHYVVVH